MKKCLLSFACLFLLPGCAFKSPNGQAPTIQAPESLSISVGWKDTKSEKGITAAQGELTAQGLRVFESPRPISIPTTPPEDLHINIGLPKGGTLSSVDIRGIALNAQGDPAQELQISRVPTEEEGSVDILLHGLTNLLSKTDEGKTTIELRAAEPAGGYYLFRFQLTTPPRRVQVSQSLLPDFENKHDQLKASLRRLDSAQIRLRLLQVVSVKNLSTALVAYKIPIHPRGELKTSYMHAEVRRSLCSYTTNTTQTEHRLSEDVFVLPLDESIVTNAPHFLNTWLPSGQYEVQLEPNATQYFGIYATGQDVERLAEGVFERPKQTVVEVVGSCRAWCAQNSYIYPDRTGIWAQPVSYWQSHGNPSEASTCNVSRCLWAGIEATLKNQPVDFEQCAQCAEWELRNGTMPWDEHRFCRGNAPGNPWGYAANESWIVEKHVAKTLEGTQGNPITLEFPESEIGMMMYFPNTNLAGMPETRSVQLLDMQTQLAE